MRVSAAALLTSASALGTEMSFGGSEMSRQYTKYNKIPVGEDDLSGSGWHKHTANGCDSHLGFAWTKKSSGPTHAEPLIVYTTAGGQQAGIGTMIMSWHGDPGLHPNQQKWATSPSSIVVGPADQFQVNVAFRSGSLVCSGATNGNLIGDVLIVNPGGAHSKNLPLTESESASEGWHRGSCFDSMGWHRFFDTSTSDGSMSYGSPANLLPVTAMYHNGEINAFFFSSVLDQVSIPLVKYNGWEPVCLSDGNMCMNTCDSDCTFGDLGPNGPWSTMHIYLKDPSTVTCEPNLHCGVTFPFKGGCCETNVHGVTDVQV